jgi:hypothetical protein
VSGSKHFVCPLMHRVHPFSSKLDFDSAAREFRTNSLRFSSNEGVIKRSANPIARDEHCLLDDPHA